MFTRKASTFAMGLVIQGLALAKSPLFDLTYMTPAGHHVTWKTLPIQLCVSSKMPVTVANHFSEAISAWNQTLGRTVFSTGCNLKSARYIKGDTKEYGVYWVTSGFEKFTDKTSLARTILENDKLGNATDVDMILNGEYYDWAKLPIDAQTIFIHELGHALGLKHYFLDLDSAMNYFPYVSGYTQRNLGTYEKLVFDALYNKKSVSVPAYMSLYFRNQIPDAINSLEKIKTKSLAELYALAVLYKTNHKLDLAKTTFALILKHQPKLAYVRQQYADVIWSLGDTDTAEKEFLQTIVDDPKNYQAMANLGALYQKKGDRRSIEFLKKSLAIQPAHWVVCDMLFAETKDPKYKLCSQKFGPTQKP